MRTFPDKEVTDLVDFDYPDGECLPITKCVCGAKYNLWEEILSIYSEDAWKCPNCGISLYFRNQIYIYSVNRE